MKDLLPKKKLTSSESEESMENQRNKQKFRKILVFGILAAILLTIWSVNRRKENSNVAKDQSINPFERLRNSKQASSNIEQRLSMGEKILIGADDNPSKKLAVEKFAAGQFQEAQTGFTNSLESYPNDPEALIYLNNSLAAFDTDAIQIGVSVPIGGSLDVAKEILRGVAQAQNEINKEGGIEQNGENKLIQVQIANDDNEPEAVQQIAASFVANPEIMAVVGHNSSGASIAGAPIYQQGNLAMISPTSTARELSQAGNYILRTTPSGRELAETMAEYSIDINRQKVAICIDSSSTASVSFKEEFSLSLFESGGEIPPTNCDFSSENFNPDEIPARAISDGAEALLLIPSVDKINQALEVAKANENRLTLLGNDSMYTYETLKVGQSDVNGLVLPAAWHPDATSGSKFNQNAGDLWGMEGNWRTATAYDATKAILTGLSSASTRQELQQNLTNPGFSAQGASGKVSFQLSGDRKIKKAFLIKIQPGKSSGTQYDFYSINTAQSTENSLESSTPSSPEN